MNQGRQRHQSAGQLPAGATATIHYRPAQWQPINGEPTLQTEFSLNNEVSSLLTDNMSERGQYNYSQSQPATPGGGIDNGGPPAGYSYSVIGVANTGNHSHHSSYRNTPIPQEFQGENGDMEIGHLVNSAEEEIEPVNQKGKENNDDLDLALDALRDCDTDFIKFDQFELQENGSTVNN